MKKLVIATVCLAVLTFIGLQIYVYMLSIKNKVGILQEQLNEKMQTWRSKDSLMHAKISVLETENLEQMLKIESQDSSILELQNLITKYKNKLKHQGNVVKVKTKTYVESVQQTDSSTVSTVGDHSPVYWSVLSDKDQWYRAEIRAGRDSTRLKLFTRNEYAVIIGSEPRYTGIGRFFASPKYFAEVINSNPYTETTSLRAYQLKMPKVKRFGVGPYIGFGIDYQARATVSLGLSVHWSVWQF